MPKVSIEPLGRTIEAEKDATIMEAALANGLYWPTTCGGEGICTSCACTIEEGERNLTPMGRSERKTLASEFSPASIQKGRMRLACQARVQGDVRVSKRGVRPSTPSALTLD
ncbi:MAG: 2Fe-2S iron-sulfur cluster-binding protein [Dehalococcoidia bacterium]